MSTRALALLASGCAATAAPASIATLMLSPSPIISQSMSLTAIASIGIHGGTPPQAVLAHDDTTGPLLVKLLLGCGVRIWNLDNISDGHTETHVSLADVDAQQLNCLLESYNVNSIPMTFNMPASHGH